VGGSRGKKKVEVEGQKRKVRGGKLEGEEDASVQRAEVTK
jgi:hypothetical protein